MLHLQLLLVWAQTLREAFGRLVRYGRLVGDAATPRLEDGGDRVRLVLDVTTTERPADEAIDALLALLLRVARLLRDNRALNPLRVESVRQVATRAERLSLQGLTSGLGNVANSPKPQAVLRCAYVSQLHRRAMLLST